MCLCSYVINRNYVCCVMSYLVEQKYGLSDQLNYKFDINHPVNCNGNVFFMRATLTKSLVYYSCTN